MYFILETYIKLYCYTLWQNKQVPNTNSMFSQLNGITNKSNKETTIKLYFIEAKNDNLIFN